MKNLKTYSQLFENTQELTPEQIKWLNHCTGGGTWKLNPHTGLVDVKGGFYCYVQDLTDFKGVRFGTVGGDFNCANNQLTSLEGAPQEVWDFHCHNNQLTSLEGAPQKVGDGFYCGNNQLTTLEGAPKRVGEYLKCDNNQLTSLEGAPRIWEGSSISGSFDDNPVSNDTLRKIFSRMNRDESYLHAVENIWKWVPLEDQALLYRPEFDWVKPEARRKLEALQAYHGFKGMI